MLDAAGVRGVESVGQDLGKTEIEQLGAAGRHQGEVYKATDTRGERDMG